MAENNSSLPDTNVILRYLLKDQPETFAEAERYFESVRTGKESVQLLESVVVECVYVLSKFYKVPRDKVAETLTGLLHYKGVVNRNRTVLVGALTLFARHNLDMVDCVLLAKAGEDEQKIITYDKALQKLAAKRSSGKTG